MGGTLLLGPADKALLAAVFAQVGMTFALLVWLGRARAASAARREVKLSDVALSSDAWSDRIKQIANSFANQFELPVLFYVAALLALVTRQADWIVVALAWAFVALRVVHANIHVTHNHVIRRFQVYVAGFAMLAALWLYLAVRLLVLPEIA